MANAVRWIYYLLVGFLPLGVAIYLLVTAKRNVGQWIIGLLLLLIAVMMLASHVNVPRRISTLRPEWTIEELITVGSQIRASSPVASYWD